MVLIMYLLSFFLFGLAMFMSADGGGLPLGMYFDMISFLIVFFPTIFLTVASYSFSDVSSAFKNLLTGLNFKENSASDLAKVIKKLMKSNTLRQKMSFNSIQIVSDKFNTNNMSKIFFDFLNKVVN